MPQLKYFDIDTQEWKIVNTDGNHVRFSSGEYSGRTLLQVIGELKAIASGGAITSNTFDFHTLIIEEDGQREVVLPTAINPERDAFLLFLNPGVLSTDSYSLSNSGHTIVFKGDLCAGDVLYLVIFKTVRMAPPDSYDGIIISEGSIQESKLAPTIQKKIREAISSSEKGTSIATLVHGKVPLEQLPSLDYSDLYAPLNHSHQEYALVNHTHNDLANKEDLLAHIENTSLHTTESEKEVLQHIKYSSEKKSIELEDANVNGNLFVQEHNILESIKNMQDKPSSNSKSIIISETEPTNPNENDIWIVI